jgi:hypothetical protein
MRETAPYSLRFLDGGLIFDHQMSLILLQTMNILGYQHYCWDGLAVQKLWKVGYAA